MLHHFQLPETIIHNDDRKACILALKGKRTEGTDEYLILLFFYAARKQMADKTEQKQKSSRLLQRFRTKDIT